MLVKINYHANTSRLRCDNLVTWRDSFEKINSELDIAKRKKQALENLHNAGRVSQFAYECLNKELTDETEQIETRRKTLAEKMTGKLNELEEQRMALEMFLANTEMAYVAGEINDEIHSKESSALDLGLEATKQELSWIKEAIIQLVPNDTETTAPEATPSESVEVTASEVPLEKEEEASPTEQVDVPVEVTATVSEANVEQLQPSTETSAETQTAAGEPGEASFRPPSEETPK